MLRDFLTYDEIWFVLFPLYVQSTKNPGNHVSRSILFPIFGWGTGDDQWSWWRVWPIYGTATYVGFYDRKFALWPIWNSEANYLDTASPSSEWSIWPIYGQIEQGCTAQPLDSLASLCLGMERRDLLLDGRRPWPLVRIQRNGSGRPYNYTRFIPLYSHYDGEEIDSQVFLWPIFWNRSEAVPDFERDSFFFAPFYYHSRTRRLVDSKPAREQEWKLGGTSMLWPLVRDREETDGRRELDTLWPIPWPFVEGFRENWLPIFSIFTHEADGRGAHSNRAFLDLFRNEANETESRWSLPILGGHRSLADGRGEWSLLLGLLRWSSGPDGSKLLMPAIPGPGFPLSNPTPRIPDPNDIGVHARRRSHDRPDEGRHPRDPRNVTQSAGASVHLLFETARRLPRARPRLTPVIDQMYAGGVLSIPIVVLVGLFTGMVLCLQTGLELQKLGQQDLVGRIVAAAMCREMGPFVTGIILSAAVGSAMAAEMGTMAVSEELTALDVMTVDTTRFLVLPRVIALALVAPILTLFADLVGIVGAASWR